MWIELLKGVTLLIPAVVAAFLAILKLFEAQSKVVRLLGYAGVSVILVYVAGSVLDLVSKSLERQVLVRESPKWTPRIGGRVMAEASGGSFLPAASESDQSYAFVVDDEKDALFRLRFDVSERSYTDAGAWRLNPLGAPGANGDARIEDLEGVAADANGHLYLITSHSNTRKGEPDPSRYWLLEVGPPLGALQPQIVRAARNLRPVFENALDQLGVGDWKNMEGKVEELNVEGLALDDSGHVFFGLRSPLVHGRAILFRTGLNDAFSEQAAQLDHFEINLNYSEAAEGDPSGYTNHHTNVPHGIVGLEYDRRSGLLLVLSNAEHREQWLKPALWTLDPAQLGEVEPRLCDAGDTDVTRAGKPEAVLVHPEGPSPGLWARFVAFLRGGTNGQLSLFYDVSDRPSLYRVLDRYDLCPQLYRASR